MRVSSSLTLPTDGPSIALKVRYEKKGTFRKNLAYLLHAYDLYELFLIGNILFGSIGKQYWPSKRINQASMPISFGYLK